LPRFFKGGSSWVVIRRFRVASPFESERENERCGREDTDDGVRASLRDAGSVFPRELSIRTRRGGGRGGADADDATDLQRLSERSMLPGFVQVLSRYQR
jgi:hypothetical protein